MHSIFSYFLRRAEDSNEDANKRIAYALWFVESFPIEEFSKEEFIFYKLLEYSTKLNVSLKEKYVRTFLDAELKELVLKSKVRVSGTAELNNMEDLVQVQTLIATTKEVILGSYWELMNEVGDVEEFIADADKFMIERLDERTIEVMSKAYETRNTEKNGFVGVRDSAEGLREDVSLLLEIYDREKLEELESATASSREEELEFVCDSGIPAIDKDTLGGHRGQLFGIEAAPGMGKTRFATGVWAYRAAVVFKRNVLYFSLEQSKKEIKSLFISRHIYTLYKIEIDAKLIQFNEVPKEFEDKVKAAEIDLFESGKYGKINIQAQGKKSLDLYLESFVEKFKMLDKLQGPFDVIIVDYMGLIKQRARKKGEYARELSPHEVIQRAYQKFKRYSLNYQKFSIAVNQLNREGTEKSKKDQEIETTDAQGGMEVYRSTDYNMTITATPAMEAKRLRRISSPKKRNSEGLGQLLVKTKLACCLWQQAETNVV